jgi:hypothetical protein
VAVGFARELFLRRFRRQIEVLGQAIDIAFVERDDRIRAE